LHDRYTAGAARHFDCTETLTAFLGDQLGASAHLVESAAAPEIRACKEILVLLGALILKVQTVSRVKSKGFGSEHL
jgi:hypothetical protein